MRGPSSSISRRSVLLGAAAVASAISFPGGATTADDLLALGAEFARRRSRCARQGRRVRQLATQADDLAMARGIGLAGGDRRYSAALDALRAEIGYHEAWARWSGTVNEVAELANRIARRPARSLSDVVTKYEALQWALLDDGVLLDDAVRRQVKAFGRELRGLY